MKKCIGLVFRCMAQAVQERRPIIDMHGSSGEDCGRRIAKGTWTGEHIRLEVTEQGADVEFDCAHGQIDGPLLLDHNGKFDHFGSCTPEHGGPVRAGETPPTEKARYAGLQEGAAIRFKSYSPGQEKRWVF